MVWAQNNYEGKSVFKQFNAESQSWEDVAVPYTGTNPNPNYPQVHLKCAFIGLSADGSRVLAVRQIYNDNTNEFEEGPEVYRWNYAEKKIEAQSKSFDDGRDYRTNAWTGWDSLDISHDGKRIASKATRDGLGTQSWVKVFEEGETSWNQIFYMATANFVAGEPWDGVALNCDGTVLAFAEDNKIRVFQDDAGTNIASCPDSSKVCYITSKCKSYYLLCLW